MDLSLGYYLNIKNVDLRSVAVVLQTSSGVLQLPLVFLMYLLWERRLIDSGNIKVFFSILLLERKEGIIEILLLLSFGKSQMFFWFFNS